MLKLKYIRSNCFGEPSLVWNVFWSGGEKHFIVHGFQPTPQIFAPSHTDFYWNIWNIHVIHLQNQKQESDLESHV